MKIKKLIFISFISCIALLLLMFGLRTISIRQKEQAKAKVAIVIDDWGYNLRHLDILEEISVPITISILPNLKYSSEVAKVARKLGQEVIVHLPLEPEAEGRNIGLEKHTITAGMSKDEIVKTLKQALSSVPGASGISNHMGSRATKDSRIMSVIFAELKKSKLFFLDNLVTDESICKQLAAKMQLKFTSRNFFLDNSDDYEYIKEQFRKVTDFAQKLGFAVAIGHARGKTLQVLQEEIPLMQALGIRFVFVSNLAKQENCLRQ